MALTHLPGGDGIAGIVDSAIDHKTFGAVELIGPDKGLNTAIKENCYRLPDMGHRFMRPRRTVYQVFCRSRVCG
jgi:hypothetical protein